MDITQIRASDVMRNSRSTINDNFAALASDFASDQFPDAPSVGMVCYRTDKQIAYRYMGDNIWRVEADYSTGNAVVTEATTATFDSEGRDISKTYVKNTDIFKGATSSNAGTSGLVPKPTNEQYKNFLCGDGTWKEIPNASQNVAGLMSTSDKAKLDGVSDSFINLQKSTIGNETKPIYWNNGAPTASGSTVGSASQPVYLKGGTLTASGSTVGSASQPVYLKGGTLTAIDMVIRKQHNTTDTWIPVWSGNNLDYVLKSEIANGNGIAEQSLGTNGYVKFTNGLMIQWFRSDTRMDEDSSIWLRYPKTFSSTCFICGCLGFANELNGGSYQCGGVKNYSTSGCTVVGGNHGLGYPMIVCIGV